MWGTIVGAFTLQAFIVFHTRFSLILGNVIFKVPDKVNED